MENASKALIIAGGILVGLIIIGLLVIVLTNVGAFNKGAEEIKQSEQIAAFNKQFESYNKQILRGAEVATVINKIRNNNKTFEDNIDYQIKWKIILEEDAFVPLTKGEYNENNYKRYKEVTENASQFTKFKELYFKCTKMEYNSKTGRVENIEFTKYNQSVVNNWYS